MGTDLGTVLPYKWNLNVQSVAAALPGLHRVVFALYILLKGSI